MRVLIIGSGGREHALSWKVARSGKTGKSTVLPAAAGPRRKGRKISPEG